MSARIGGFIVMSDTFPGSWGWGADEAAAARADREAMISRLESAARESVAAIRV